MIRGDQWTRTTPSSRQGSWWTAGNDTREGGPQRTWLGRRSSMQMHGLAEQRIKFPRKYKRKDGRITSPSIYQIINTFPFPISLFSSPPPSSSSLLSFFLSLSLSLSFSLAHTLFTFHFLQPKKIKKSKKGEKRKINTIRSSVFASVWLWKFTSSAIGSRDLGRRKTKKGGETRGHIEEEEKSLKFSLCLLLDLSFILKNSHLGCR